MNVSILYPHMPHYRKAVFQALNESKHINFRFFFDRNGIDKTIVSSDFNENVINIKSSQIGKFVFQWAFIKEITLGSDDAYIFLGNPYILTNWLYATIAKLRGKKVLFWTHGWLADEVGLKSVVRNIFYKLADKILVYGENAKSIGIKKGFNPNSIKVIYNSLDYDAQKKIRGKSVAYVDSDGDYFLCSSRIVPELKLDMAIEALSQIKKISQKNLQLIIIGDGPEKAFLEDLARRLSVKVKFLGAIYDEEELAKYFLGCAAVVSPSKLGLLAMHALAYGAPVITHGSFDCQGPEVEAITPYKTGIFYKYNDVADLARVMALYLGHKRLPENTALAIQTIESKYNAQTQKKLIEEALCCLFGYKLI
jgi:glycosyltransferase involved in cell wall biosynthesis